jgi:broad specificity phosphatase PhoE
VNGLRLIASGHTPALRRAVFGGDDDLDEGGRQAALALRSSPALQTRHFPDGPWTIAPSRAAAGTTGILAPGAAVTVDPALAEPDYGTWTGHHLDHPAPAALQQWLTDPDAAPHGGETTTAVTARITAWLHDHTTGRHTVVAHPTIIRTLIGAALDLPAGHTHRLAVAPLSVTRLTCHGRWHLHFPTA